MLERDNPFWNFSLDVYAAPGVAAECLALQRTWNIDINILLFCAWLGSKNRVLTESNLAEIDARVREWRETIVLPLRGVRQNLKGMLHADRPTQ